MCGTGAGWVRKMPFSSVISPERRLVITTGTGVLTGDEGLACCTELRDRPGFDPSFNQLLDLTAATRFDATREQIKLMAQVPLFAASSRRAIVTAEAGVFGLARMFEAYRSLSGMGEQVMVFREMKLALEWLAEEDKIVAARPG